MYKLYFFMAFINKNIKLFQIYCVKNGQYFNFLHFCISFCSWYNICSAKIGHGKSFFYVYHENMFDHFNEIVNYFEK